MAATAFIQITGTVVDPSGTKTVGPFTITSATAAIDVQRANLSAGDNTLAIVTGATGVIILPPAGNAVALFLRGSTGTTGILIHKTNPTLLSLDAAATSIIINAGGTVTGIGFTWF